MTSCGVGAGLTAGPLSPRPSPRPRGAAPRRARRGAPCVRGLPIATRIVNRPSSRVCDRNASPERFTASMIAAFAASSAAATVASRSLPTRRAGRQRRQTVENGTGASSSQSGLASTSAAKSGRELEVMARSAGGSPRGRTSAAGSTASARASADRAGACNPCSRGPARRGRASAGTPGWRLNAAASRSIRRVSSSDASSGVNSHLCGLTTIESARSQPSNGARSSGTSATAPAYAASTWSHVRSRSAMSAMAATGSIDVDDVVPTVATIAIGRRPGGTIGLDRGLERLRAELRTDRRPGSAPATHGRARASCTPSRPSCGPRPRRRHGAAARRAVPEGPRPTHRRRPPRAPRRAR